MFGALGDHHRLDDVTLDVEAEDLLRALRRLVGAAGDLHPTGLAPATGLHLGLDHHHGRAELGGRGPGLLRRGRGDAPEHRDVVGLEHVAGLVLVQIHRVPPGGFRAPRPALVLTRDIARGEPSGPLRGAER